LQSSRWSLYVFSAASTLNGIADVRRFSSLLVKLD